MPVIASIFVFVLMSPSLLLAQNTCSVDLEWQIESYTPGSRLSSGSISIDFPQRSKVVPQISIQVNTNFEYDRAELRWSNIDVINSQNKPLFNSPFQEQVISLSQSSFPLQKSTDGSVLTSDFWGFLKTKVFMSLFYSQNNMYLDFYNETGQRLKTDRIALINTDLKFRNMASLCFSDRSEAFLDGVNRLQNIPLSWETSYGLMGYEEVQQISPRLYNKDFTSPEVHTQSAQALTQTLQSLEKLNQLENQYTNLTSTETNQNFFTEIDAIAKELHLVQIEISQLQGDSGRLATFQSRQGDLENQVGELRNNVDSLQSQLADREREYQGPHRRLQELEDRYQQLEDEYLAARVNHTLVSAQLADLKDLLNAPVIRDYVSAPIDSESSATASLLYPEIFQTAEELMANRQAADNLRGYQSLLQVIDSQLSELKKVTEQMGANYADLQGRRAAIAKIEGEIDAKLEFNQILEEQYMGLTHSQIVEFLQQEDPATTFTAEDLVARVRESYGRYDSLLEKTANESLSAEAVKQLLCSTASLKRDSIGLCLEPRDLENSARVSQYLNQISSDDLINLRTLWGQDAVDFNSQATQQDLDLEWMIFASSLPTQELQQAWDQVLYSRWIFFKARELSFENVNNKALLTLANDIEDKIEENRQFIQSLQREKEIFESQYDIAFTVFDVQEETFRQTSHRIKIRIQTILELDHEVIPASENIDCLFREASPLLCTAIIDDQKAFIDSTMASLDQTLATMVEQLETSLPPTVAELTTKIESLARQITDLEAEQQAFLRRHRLEQRSQLVQDLETARDTKASELEQTEEQLQETRSQLQRTEQQIEQSKKRLAILAIKFHSLQQRLAPYENQRSEYCDEITTTIEEFTATQEQLLKDFSVGIGTPLWVQEGRSRCFVINTPQIQLQ